MEQKEIEPKFKVNQRVSQTLRPWCLGTVSEIREEATLSKIDKAKREACLMYAVQWDNGTLSYFGPEALQSVE